LTSSPSVARAAWHRFVWLLGFACAALLPLPGSAARVAVVLSDDSEPYREVYHAVRTHLGDATHSVEPAYAATLPPSAVRDAGLVVAVGVRAAEAIAGVSGRPPVLAVLVPRTWYLQTGRQRLGADQHVVSAIYLDQPFDRQAKLIREALPEARRVGVVISAEQAWLAAELGSALRAQQLALVEQTIAADTRLIRPLEAVLGDADVLLAVPDAQVFNRNTAQSLFLTSYRYRVPVVGYSASLTRAGALVSLHSSPAQIGRHAAEWVRQALRSGTRRVPGPAYPAYYSVSVNAQVARSLGIVLPSERELEQRLGARP
jgi:hypothetical protein